VRNLLVAVATQHRPGHHTNYNQHARRYGEYHSRPSLAVFCLSSANEKTEWHRVIWNGLAEYAADKLKKGDHLYVVGTLVSNVYEKEVGKGKNKAKAPIMSWQIKAFSIRKVDRKDTAPTTAIRGSRARAERRRCSCLTLTTHGVRREPNPLLCLY
jgi:hypothetical protein